MSGSNRHIELAESMAELCRDENQLYSLSDEALIIIAVSNVNVTRNILQNSRLAEMEQAHLSKLVACYATNIGVENFHIWREAKQAISEEDRFSVCVEIARHPDIISKATVLFIFDYLIRGVKIFRFIIEAGFKKRLDRFIEFRIEMFNL